MFRIFVTGYVLSNVCIAGREHKLHYKGENLLSLQLQKAVCVHQLVARLALLLDGLCAPSLWKQLHAASELDSDKKEVWIQKVMCQKPEER